ncbi:uncharacterized protein MYCFIDRAFT_155659 [Pseudocercospora fijiensis CIRAD86]|uniref:C2H2-type domain-containing protein n=1 Tax=Pseudocercospora fijiensis (strain CIRAD86) TaxID=383855 RepID=M3AVI9_PSEFD|nr:uncharacterized protein MYCFIDRAFT_155659 [Pseudocercospora fijiensis CIRAD86]EME81497.1 hypothetical protein MYCFIDRAFT_155659 [Pseudocercospora fijiensis CIRAD86]
MNYSNMIEEKALKKTFIIATLVSTIVGTFTASIALHDKIKEKQEKAANAKKQQQGVDDKQDKGLEELKERLGELENKADKGKEVSDNPMEDDDFAQATGRSKAMLEETYEQNVGQLGQNFAQGDLVTENALQKQVIDLQQVVISVLQGAVSDSRALTEDDMRQIIMAQDKARDGSISALNAQRDRLLAEQQRKEQGDKTPTAVQSPPLSQRSARGSPPPGPETIKSLPAPPPALFCRYAKDLQKNPWRPLGKAFSRSGTHSCPDCHIPIPVDTRDVWVLSTHFPNSSSNSLEKIKNRDYRMDARFVVKCHTADGRGYFACVLCDKWRDIDCICRDVDALVKHLGTAHTPDEFEKDSDLVRMKDGSIVKSSTGREMALA